MLKNIYKWNLKKLNYYQNGEECMLDFLMYNKCKIKKKNYHKWNKIYNY